MDSQHFERAREAYAVGEYVEALKEYYACLKEDNARFSAGDAGLIYYRLGNCLLKMRSFQEASATYQKALEDPAFGDKTSVLVNLGKSQIGLGDYEGAITSFNTALADRNYQKQYQAQMGLGAAFSRLGMVVDAGNAYRSAALDERNPNPIKALMQLGLCFEALGRPQDAIESYKAIFDFNPKGAACSKAYESLGQSYVATGQHREAIEAFTSAVAEGRYALSQEAFQDYQKALEALKAESTQMDSRSIGSAKRATVSSDATDLDPFASYHNDEVYGAGNVPLAHDTGFFTATDDDLIALSKKQMRKERKLRNIGLKVLLIIMILLVIALGLTVYAYWQGFGYPTQQMVVTSLFEDHARGKDVLDHWIDGEQNEAAIRRKMDMVATTDQIEFIYMNSQMTEAEAIVIAKLKDGGTLRYEIRLERDMLGWKIADLNLIFESTQ